MAPEGERVPVGRVVGLRPGDEVDERLRIAHVALAPVCDGACGVGLHPLGDVEEFVVLRVATAGVVAGGLCRRIPLGLANFKLITVGLRPFGREIVSVDEAKRRVGGAPVTVFALGN